ncbi:MAG: hypothetical protein M1812_002509 [Candelaria pacifica]|nr:MAG: hypothetical protein M1812_002509 [Candelaria pacifica]
MNTSSAIDAGDAGAATSTDNMSLLENIDIDNVAFPLLEDPRDVTEFLTKFIDKDFRKILLDMSRGNPLSNHDRQLTVLLVRAIGNLDLYPGLATTLLLPGTLKVIGGSNDRVVFPPEIQTMAKDVRARFEAQEWGENLVLDDGDGEDQDASNSSAPATSQSTSAPRPTAPRNRLVNRPSPNHSIFGTNGIMRGLLIKQGPTRVYQFDDTFPRRDANVFGANGLTIGDWWPLQRCALRDGAHGATMAGIAGKNDEGAYSIVVAGQYADLDDDYGDMLWYSASNSHSNTDPNVARVSGGALVLRQSIVTQRPVRVLRSFRGESSFAPSAGIRYDGLYHVVREGNNTNTRGGLYIRFRLQRLPNQPPIVRNRPTMAEIAQSERIVRGY